MNFEQYINNDYSPLQVQATVYDVKKVFEELPFTHFPVVDDGKLLGMLAQSDIMHFPKERKRIIRNTSFFFSIIKRKVKPIAWIS
jgi:CBS domain-containing protein